MRQDGSIEGVLQAKFHTSSTAARGNKGKGKKENYANYEAISTRNNSTAIGKKKEEGKYPPCQYCGRRNHPY